MLTQTQKAQLHKDLLEYLSNNNYTKTANIFAEEAELSSTDVDPEGNKLIIKWKSILNLQKKINNLEEKVQSLEE